MDLHWLPVERRIEFKILMMCFKSLHGLAPPYLSDLISWHTPNRRLRSGAQHLLTEPTWRLKTFGYRRFGVAAPRLWNALPITLRSMQDLSKFKKGLKTHLYSKEYHWSVSDDPLFHLSRRELICIFFGRLRERVRFRQRTWTENVPTKNYSSHGDWTDDPLIWSQMS